MNTKRSRVDPWGRIIESSARGYFMGNRDFGDAWITCSLRHPDGSTGPSTVGYFKLFFLDEATALAAGHRPCAQCRRKDYNVFTGFWKSHSELPIDKALRKEVAAAEAGSAESARPQKLPAGAMFELDGKAYLAWQRVAYLWSPSGYSMAGLLEDMGRARILTSPATVTVLESGYRPWVHPSVLLPRGDQP